MQLDSSSFPKDFAQNPTDYILYEIGGKIYAGNKDHPRVKTGNYSLDHIAEQLQKNHEGIHDATINSINKLIELRNKKNIKKIEKHLAKKIEPISAVPLKSLPLVAKDKSVKQKEEQAEFLFDDTPTKTVITDEIFGHLLGDTFLKESGLEGQHGATTCGYAIAHIKEILEKDVPAQEKYCLSKLAKRLEGAVQIETDLQKISNFAQKEKCFSTTVDDILEKDGSCLIPGGWEGEPYGHAIYYHIIKQDDGDYTFRLFNTGMGVEYHESELISEKEKILPYVEIQNIKKEDLFDEYVIKFIVEMRTFSQADMGILTDYGPKDIYEVLLPMLKGDRVTVLPDDLVEFMSAQQSGTCAWKGLLPFMRKSIIEAYPKMQKQEAARFFHRFHTHLKYKTLVKYAHSTFIGPVKFQKIQPVEKRNLIKKSCEAFLRSIKRQTKIKALTLAEATKMQSSVNEILETIRSQELSYREQCEHLASKVDLSAQPKLSESFQSFALPEPKATVPQAAGLISKSFPIFTDIYSIENLSPETLHEQMRQFNDELQEQFKNKNYEAVNYAIRTFFEKLPIPQVAADPFWSQIGIDQAKEIISLVTSISELNTRTCFHLAKDKLPMQNAVSMIKGLAIQHRLISQFKDDFELQDFPLDIPMERLENLLEGKPKNFADLRSQSRKVDRSFFSPHMSVMVELHELLDYFKSRNQGVSEKSDLFVDSAGLCSSRWGLIENQKHTIDEESITKSKKIQFIKQYLAKHPEKDSVIDTLAVTYNCPSPNTAFMRYGLALSDLEGDILPFALCAINKQSAMVNQFLSGIFFKPENFIAKDDSFKIKTMVTFDQQGKNLYVERRFEGIINDQAGPGKGLELAYGHAPVGFTIRGKENYDVFYYSYNSAISNWQSIIQHATSDLPLKETQALLRIFNFDEETRDSDRSLKINKLFAYFFHNFERLKDPFHQEFFKVALYRDGLLAKALRLNPKLAKPFYSFCINGYKMAADDIPTSIFFLNLARNIEHYIKQNVNLEALPDEDNPNFINTQKVLLELAKSLKRGDPNLGVILREYIAAFILKKYPLEKDEIFSIFKNYFALNVTGIAVHKDLIVADEVGCVITKSLPLIDSILKNTAVKDKFLNEILHLLIPHYKKQKWIPDPKFPFFKNKKGNLSINLAEGRLFELGKAHGTLPSAILEDDYYKIVFGSKQFTATKDNESCYTFTDDENVKCKVYRLEGKIIIHKFINNEWMEFVPNSDINLGSKILKDKYTHWIQVEPDPVTAFQKMILLELESNKIAYEIALEKNVKNEYQPASIVCKKEGDYQGLRLVNIYKKGLDFDFLANFDTIDQIHMWANASGEPQFIEIPRHNIKLEINPERQIKWKGLILSKNQYINGLEGFKNYLVFEDPKKPGQKKVLLPNRPILTNKKGSLNIQFKLELEKQKSGNSYFEYRLNSKNKIIGTSQAGNLHLAHIFLAQKEYKLALEYLNHFGNKHTKYSDEERSILLSIAGFQEDQDPFAQVVRLKAVYLERTNANKFPIGLDQFVIPWEEYANQMNSYLQNRMNHQSLNLSQSEEEYLTEFFAFYPSPLLVYHLSSFNPGYAEEILDEFNSQVASQIANSERVLFFNTEFLKQYYGAAGLPIKILSRPGNAFASHFFYNYAIAKSGDPDAIAALKKALELAKFEKNDLNPMLRKVLNYVIDNPADPAFPDPKVDAETILNSVFPRCVALQEKELTKLQEEELTKNYGLERVIKKSQKFIEKSAATPASEAPKPAIGAGDHLTLAAAAPVSGIQLDHFIKKIETHKFLESSKNTLLATLTVDKDDPLKVKENDFIKKDIEIAYDEAQKQQAYRLRDISTLAGQINGIKGELQKEIDIEKEKIMKLAKRLPAEEMSRFFQSIAFQSKEKHQPTIDDLVIAFIQQSRDVFCKLNPAFMEDSYLIESLNQRIFSYLEKSTRLQAYNRALENMETVQEDMEKGKPQNPDIVKIIMQNLTTTRNYNLHERPHFLVYEYFTELSLRKDQVENINKLFKAEDPSYENLLLQMIMGSGKSKVLLPILALLKANGENLSMVIVPEFQYESSTEDLSDTSRDAFRQRTVTLDFSRDPECLDNLEELESLLLHTIANRNYLIVTAKTMHNLNLKFQEALEQYSSSAIEEPELWENIKKMQDILRLFKSKGDVIIDEADLILNNRHEVNYSVGEAKLLQQGYTDLCGEIFDLLINPKEIEKGFLFEFNKSLAVDKQAALSLKATYNKETKPKLIKALIAKFKSQPTNASLQTVSEKLKSFKKDRLRDLFEYLMNLDTPRANRFEQFLEGLSLDGVEGSKNRIFRDLMALLKNQLNDTLSLTLFKTYNVNYGFSPNLGFPFAIPYIANNTPSLTSQFDNNFVQINYTLQMYYKNGLPQERMKLHIEQLQDIIRKKQAVDQMLKIKETEEYQEFRRLCPDPTKNLFSVTNDDRALKEITERFAKSPELIEEHLKKYVIPKFESFNMRITSGAQNLVGMFSKVQGFTGTPWNRSTYHNKLKVEVAEGTDGRSLLLLMKDVQKVSTLSEQTVDAQLNRLFEMSAHDGESYTSIIDTGALFKGISNLEMAEKILSMQKGKIKGVVFYNKENKQMILQKGKKDPIPLQESSLKEDERFTFYDQHHTTGSDIRQSTNAKAFLTMSKDLMLRDLLQGMWRLRQIDKGQAIEIILPAEAEQTLRVQLRLPAGQPVKMEHIIAFVHQNQVEQQAKDNIVSIKQKADSLVQRFFMDYMIEIDDGEKLKQAFKAVSDLFIKLKTDDPFAEFGRRDILIDSAEYLAELREIVIKQIDDLTVKFEKIIPLKPAQIDILKAAVVQAMIDPKILPKKLPKLSAGKNEESTVETEKVEQAEQESEAEKEQISESSGEGWSPSVRWFWSEHAKGKTFDASLYQIREEGTLDQLQIGKKESIDGGLGYDYIGETTNPPPIFSISEVLNQFQDLAPFASAFSEDLAASYNLFKLRRAEGAAANHPFGQNQQPCDAFLVVQDKAMKKFKVIMLDDGDAAFFHNQLLSEKAKPVQGKQVNYCVCDFYTGIISEGSESLRKDMEKDKDLQLLIVQTKFLRGEVSYTEEEQAILKDWLSKQKNLHDLHKLFRSKIVKKHQSAAAYPVSPIAKIFKGLEHDRGVEVAA